MFRRFSSRIFIPASFVGLIATSSWYSRANFSSNSFDFEVKISPKSIVTNEQRESESPPIHSLVSLSTSPDGQFILCGKLSGGANHDSCNFVYLFDARTLEQIPVHQWKKLSENCDNISLDVKNDENNNCSLSVRCVKWISNSEFVAGTMCGKLFRGRIEKHNDFCSISQVQILSSPELGEITCLSFLKKSNLLLFSTTTGNIGKIVLPTGIESSKLSSCNIEQISSREVWSVAANYFNCFCATETGKVKVLSLSDGDDADENPIISQPASLIFDPAKDGKILSREATTCVALSSSERQEFVQSFFSIGDDTIVRKWKLFPKSENPRLIQSDNFSVADEKLLKTSNLFVDSTLFGSGVPKYGYLTYCKTFQKFNTNDEFLAVTSFDGILRIYRAKSNRSFSEHENFEVVLQKQMNIGSLEGLDVWYDAANGKNVVGICGSSTKIATVAF